MTPRARGEGSGSARCVQPCPPRVRPSFALHPSLSEENACAMSEAIPPRWHAVCLSRAGGRRQGGTVLSAVRVSVRPVRNSGHRCDDTHDTWPRVPISICALRRAVPPPLLIGDSRAALAAQQACQTIQPGSTLRTSALDQQIAHAAWISKPVTRSSPAVRIGCPRTALIETCCPQVHRTWRMFAHPNPLAPSRPQGPTSLRPRVSTAPRPRLTTAMKPDRNADLTAQQPPDASRRPWVRRGAAPGPSPGW